MGDCERSLTPQATTTCQMVISKASPVRASPKPLMVWSAYYIFCCSKHVARDTGGGKDICARWECLIPASSMELVLIFARFSASPCVGSTTATSLINSLSCFSRSAVRRYHGSFAF